MNRQADRFPAAVLPMRHRSSEGTEHLLAIPSRGFSFATTTPARFGRTGLSFGSFSSNFHSLSTVGMAGRTLYCRRQE
jgi:hypothetical protein